MVIKRGISKREINLGSNEMNKTLRSTSETFCKNTWKRSRYFLQKTNLVPWLARFYSKLFEKVEIYQLKLRRHLLLQSQQ